MFDLPAKQGHKEETPNKRTAKRELPPTTSAAGTGRTEEVEQWLKMEAGQKDAIPTTLQL